MSENDAFDAFRKRLRERRDQEEAPEPVDGEEEGRAPSRPAAKPAGGEGRRLERGGQERDGAPPADPLARFRAARARLEASRSRRVQPGEPPADDAAARRDAGGAAGGRGRPRRGSGGGQLRVSRGSRTTRGDGFEDYRRAREEARLGEAKRRAFDEGVEVQGLAPGRLHSHHHRRLSAEELEVERNELVDRWYALRLSPEEIEAAREEMRPEGYETHRAHRMTVEELEERGGALEKPEGYETHRAERIAAEIVVKEVSRPGEEGSAVTSHRYRFRRVKAEERERTPDDVPGYRKHDF